MENIKIPFFKRVKRAIVNFESYSNFAVDGFKVALNYIGKLTLIFAIIISIAYAFQFSKMINDEEQLQIIRNQIQEASGLEMEEIDQSIQSIKENNGFELYIILALNLWILFFTSIFLYSLMYAVIVSSIGLLTSALIGMRLKYKAIYTMSIYALTLPIILNCIYAVANVLIGFTIDYFFIVYISIACIYVITAILMIKTDLIERQKELMKIINEQEKIKREHEQNNNENPEEKPEDKEEKPKDAPPEEPLGEANSEAKP